MDILDKKNISRIINSFGDSEYIDVENLIKNKIVDCDAQQLKKLIEFLEVNDYITCIGLVAEWDVSLPLIIRETEKLKKERIELKSKKRE
jgi:hypothetical protein